MEEDKIKVKVIQAHKIPLAGSYEEYRVGDEIYIERKDFSPNLHRRIKEKATSEKMKEKEVK